MADFPYLIRTGDGKNDIAYEGGPGISGKYFVRTGENKNDLQWENVDGSNVPEYDDSSET